MQNLRVTVRSLLALREIVLSVMVPSARRRAELRQLAALIRKHRQLQGYMDLGGEA